MTLPLFVIRFLTALVWLIFGGTAALWWLPAALGAAKPLTWQYGALMLAMQWIWVFNHWPVFGTRRFFHENRFLKLQLFFLGLISVSFAAGFAVVPQPA